MFPSLDENKPFQSFEAATAHAKITALVRIVSIVSSFLFWLESMGSDSIDFKRGLV
jgi:hypothetical protein